LVELLSFLPEPLPQLVTALILAGVLVSFIGVQVMFFIWVERKVSGRIQDRLGPTRTGGFLGWAQSLADGIKLLAKEDFAPGIADKLLFRAAPYFAFCAAFTAYLALPFSANLVGYPMEIGAFFMLSVLASEVFGVILAGYASGSKWSLFGGVREAAQVISYEIPRSICVLIPVILAGTLDLSKITDQQAGFFWNWNLFHDPFTMVAFVVFFICATASCKRAPFDLAEAESELVAGFLTEYSGLRWSFFFMAEYASMFAMSALASILFLGGWHTGILPDEATTLLGIVGHAINVITLILKCWVLILVMMWMRWSLPRLRIDQVMTTCLKYFLPIGMVLLVGVCLWQLAAPPWLSKGWRWVAGGGTLFLHLLVLQKLIWMSNTGPRDGLPGVWAGRVTPLNMKG
jgi:NADH-quinone oxidoreductase subunit H